MDAKTNLAIIGYGYMGKVYKKACFELYDKAKLESYYKYDLPVLLKDFRLKAVVDTGFDGCHHDEREGIWYFNSLRSFLDHRDLQVHAAVVATPIPTHYEIARILAQHRISLLVEKPVCETAKRIKNLISLAKKNRIKIMPGHVERYNPVTLEAAEAVTYRMYGKLRTYRFLRESAKPERVKEGLILDKLIHDLDLVHRIIGKFSITDIQVKRIDGEIRECILSTAHRRGITGEIVSSWLAREKKREVTMEFERGSLRGDLIHKVVHIDRYMELVKTISGYRNNQIKDQLVDFIAYLNNYGRTLVTMRDALESAYLIDEINRKVKNGF